MAYKERIPKELFDNKGHYAGRPADFEDRIIQRRLRLLKAIPNFTGKQYSLLEIGCGNGATMFGLCDNMKVCHGLEITNEHQQDFENHKQALHADNCTYTITDIENAEPTAQYDRLVSFEVIEHLKNEKSLQYYHQALKTGGLMAISVPNKWWIFETHGAKLPLLPWNRVPFFSWLPTPIHERWAHARIYTKKRITRLLQAHGFEIISVEYITAPMDVLPQGKLKDFLISTVFKNDTTTIPFKSTSIFVVAKKK